jgi:hypothetical protein
MIRDFYIRLIFGTSLFLALQSCGSYKYQTDVYEYVFAEVDTLYILVHQKGKKVKGEVLLIPEYDSLYESTIKRLVGPITRKKFRVIEVQKFGFDNYAVRSGTDDLEFYLDQITDGFNVFQSQKDSMAPQLPLYILGVHEGAIVAPRLAISLNAEKLYLVNPHFTPYRELFIQLTQLEDKARVERFLDGLYMTSREEALAWFHFIEITDPTDRLFAQRSVKYWKVYFDFQPDAYFTGWEGSLKILLFEDFPLNIPIETSKRELLFRKRKPNDVQVVPGHGRNKSDYQTIEKWLKKEIGN